MENNSPSIALFGGSFNPPHLGHEAVVQFLVTQFDEVWILPSFAHPFEKPLLCFEDRLLLCELAFKKVSSKVAIKPYEQQAGSPQGYTIDLIHFLKNKFPHSDFSWVMGSDLFLEKEKWKNFDALTQLVKIYSIPRSGYEKSSFPLIASSKVRELIQSGDAVVKNLLNSEVYHFIQEKRLYL